MSRTKSTFAPPVMEARRWLDGVEFPADRPLINVSQAAPVDPPPPQLVGEMARVLGEDDTHLYGPVLGLLVLRNEIAQQWSMAYQGTIPPDHVAITSGCNQGFAAAIAALCEEGDQVILPTPFYFNHKMWLDMAGVNMVALPCGDGCGDGMIPDPAQAAELITDKTRAIVLVTPNNPTGAEYPAGVIRAFYDLARAHNIALIVDETYRDFHSQSKAPHDLFADPDWDKTLIHLYSFSKAFRLTGHRVGTMIASPARLAEVEKFLDTVSICPTGLGQKAALWGLQNLSQWLAGERDEILTRRRAIETGFDVLAQRGWKLLGCGAYFAYVEHPFDIPSHELAPKLVQAAGILCLPGTMFTPTDDPNGHKHLRLAFANIDVRGIENLFARLAGLDS